MDTTMVNLKIISKLEPEKKLETDGLLFQHVEWSLFPEGARRWWYGHSRSVTITKIQQLYETAFAKIKGDDDKSSTPRKYSRVFERAAKPQDYICQ